MADYDNTNRGGIWKNEKKNPESDDYRDTLPDFTGELDVEGVKFFVDAWKRRPDAKPKAPALSFKVKRKEVQRAAPKADPASTGRPLGNNDLDDQIPFAPEFR